MLSLPRSYDGSYVDLISVRARERLRATKHTDHVVPSALSLHVLRAELRYFHISISIFL